MHIERTSYILLIHKQLTGQLQEDERAELERWVHEADENRRVFETYRQLWRMPEASPFSPARKLQQRARLLNRVREDVQQRDVYRFKIHRLAAALMFFITSALMIVYMVNAPVTIIADEKQNVWLADSAHIILQPKSAISFYYSPDELTASFKGEGLFELVHASAITLPGATVHTAAASFMIKSKADGHTAIEVLSGVITVSAEKGDVVVRANQQCIVDEAGLHVSRLQLRGS